MIGLSLTLPSTWLGWVLLIWGGSIIGCVVLFVWDQLIYGDAEFEDEEELDEWLRRRYARRAYERQHRRHRHRWHW